MRQIEARTVASALRAALRRLGSLGLLTWVSASIALAAASTVHAGGVAVMLRDVETTPADPSPAGARRLGKIGGEVFFAGRDGAHGTELWRSDGSAAGTALVADIRPGSIGSFPSAPVDVGDGALFLADDGVHGQELWASDGTAEGTRLVLDIRPGPEGSAASGLVAIGGVLYFTADDGATGSEPWRSDGTPEGTHPLGDVAPGALGSNPQNFSGLDGGTVLFVANDGSSGFEPWVSDGTPGGATLVADVHPGPGGIFDPAASQFWAHRGAFPVLAGDAYFPANDGTSGFELWRSDGTPEGTEMLADATPGPGSSFPSPRLVDGEALYFTLSASVGSLPHLWRTDGTPEGTEEVAAVGPSPFEDIVAHDGAVYFVAERSALWKSDGTDLGTEMVYEIGQPGCAPKHFFKHLTPFGDRLFLVGRAPGADEELWVTDGTTGGTHEVKDIRSARGDGPRQLRALDDVLVFLVDDGVHGRELWKSDGSASGTSLVADLFQPTESFFPLGRLVDSAAPLDGKLYFTSFGRVGLWRTDGTGPGTEPSPGAASHSMPNVNRAPEQIVVSAGEQLFVWTASGAFDVVLRRTDGTAAGTRSLGVFDATCGVAEQVVLDGDLLFGGCKPDAGMELWRSDGTVAGTKRVSDIRPGSLDSSPRGFTVLGDRMVFFANDGARGVELWRTDGFTAEILLDVDAGPGDGVGFGLSEAHLDPMPSNGEVAFFVGFDALHGWELWRTDGTAAGTRLVKDVVPGPSSGFRLFESQPALGAWALTERGTLYFLRFASGRGWELWRSDGSEAGTAPVDLVLPEDDFPVGVAWLLRLWTVGETAYFTGPGYRLWRSDGTPGGTTPFPEDLDALSLALRSGAFYFEVSDGGGTELRVLERGASQSASLGRIEGEGAGLDALHLTTLAGRPFFSASEVLTGSELWTSSCGDGVVEHDEACDDGPANGLVGSCCTRGCEVRTWPASDVDGDGMIDWCDPEDGALNLDRVTVRSRPTTARADGRIRVHGSFFPAPLLDDPDDYAVRVTDAGSLDAAIAFDRADCVEKGNVTRCRIEGEPFADLRLRRVLNAVEVRLIVRRLGVDAALAGPVTVSLTRGEVFDQVGVSAPCRGSATRLVCR